VTVSSAKPSSDSDRKPVLALGPAQVHLWLRQRDAVADSGAFARGVLSRYADIAPADWRFSEGEHGRPEAVDAPLPLSFNISHSGDWIACAVSAGDPVGVDIEKTGTGRDVMRLARRFFHADEIADLERLEDEAELRQRFYDYWTLKEAAVKARGLPLAPALNTVSFKLEKADGPGPLALRVGRKPDGNNAAYYLLDPVPGYRLALCLLGGGHRPHLFLDDPGARGLHPVPASMLRASSWAQ
jgi:4'-phosphopantetheinyl transferase